MTNISFISVPPNAQVNVVSSITPTPICPIPTAVFDYRLILITSTTRTICFDGFWSTSGNREDLVEYKWYIDGIYKGEGMRVEYIVDHKQHTLKLTVKNNCGNYDSESKTLAAHNIPTPSPTPPTTKLNQFRQACISDETVNVGWSSLKPYMVNRTVSEIWWYLTEKERRSILKLADSNIYPTTIPLISDGQDNCKGSYNNWIKAWCRNHTTIKLHIYGKPVTDNCKSFYYQTKSGSKHCYYTSQYYDLPYNYVAVRGPAISGTEYFAHAMCGIQVNKDTSTYNSWVLFQYGDHDIKPNCYQIPTHTYDLTMYIYKYIDLPSIDKIIYVKQYTFKL